MKITENEKFKSVSLYPKTISSEDLKSAGASLHMDDRSGRKKLAEELESDIEIDEIFLVDKGHANGSELHVVTKGGIIYILNNLKYQLGMNSLVTILFPRPNQVQRLYEACNLDVPEDLAQNCVRNIKKGFNN